MLKMHAETCVGLHIIAEFHQNWTVLMYFCELPKSDFINSEIHTYRQIYVFQICV